MAVSCSKPRIPEPRRDVGLGSMLSIKSATSSARVTIESKCRVFESDNKLLACPAAFVALVLFNQQVE